jgi:hypothetical protein
LNGIINSYKLEEIYGRWPSFHDAEIHEIKLKRNIAVGGTQLELIIHLFQIIPEVDERGFYKSTKHNFVTIRFEEIAEMQLEDFNHQNCILDLEIDKSAKEDSFKVDIYSSYGCNGSFKCKRIEVIDVTNYNYNE